MLYDEVKNYWVNHCLQDDTDGHDNGQDVKLMLILNFKKKRCGSIFFFLYFAVIFHNIVWRFEYK